jgi:phenylacetate-coenzyme A ligase PaaK-like adenylate-forming protein
LCREVEQGRLHIQPLVISVGGEAFYSLIREALETSWPGASIFNSLGTSEGLAGVTCTANRKEMHLNDDLCIVEPVDVNGQRVDFGVLSEKIYMTNLFNFTLPLIRYEILDEITFLKKTCSCGNSFQLISELKSRADFDFVYENNIFVNHVVFAYALLADKYIREYQVIQTENGAIIKLLTTGVVDLDALNKCLIQKLMELGLIDPTIEFVNVKEFEYPPSGKLRRFIPLES